MPDSHSAAPWKLTVVGNIWGLSAKGANARNGEPDIAQGSTYADKWRQDAALLMAAPKMLDALRAAEAALADPAALKGLRTALRYDPATLKAVRAAIKAATTPVSP